MRTLWLDGVLALDLDGSPTLAPREQRRAGVCCRDGQGNTHGAAGDAVKALLALDGDVGAIWSLELDVERC